MTLQGLKRQVVVDAEWVITVREACEKFGVTERTHWIRAVHELTSERPPWALIRLQAIRRGIEPLGDDPEQTVVAGNNDQEEKP